MAIIPQDITLRLAQLAGIDLDNPKAATESARTMFDALLMQYEEKSGFQCLVCDDDISMTSARWFCEACAKERKTPQGRKHHGG